MGYIILGKVTSDILSGITRLLNEKLFFRKKILMEYHLKLQEKIKKILYLHQNENNEKRGLKISHQKLQYNQRLRLSVK